MDWVDRLQNYKGLYGILQLLKAEFKLLHRRLATNDFLNKIGIRENDICTFCRTEKESLFHLFCSCSETSFFWQGFRARRKCCPIARG